MSTETRKKTVPRPASGVVVPETAKWHGRLAARLIWLFANMLSATLRWNSPERSIFKDRSTERRAIFAIWHNRLAVSLIVYRRYIAPCGTNRHLAALVSASKDGGLLNRVLELFGVTGVRGSSSRRGAQALRELATAAGKGNDIAVTPDGPRGPRYEPHAGVIALAQITGLPIVPVTVTYGWKWTLKSWDRFQIPLPFSRCDVQLGEPVEVPQDADETATEALRLELRRRLMSKTSD